MPDNNAYGGNVAIDPRYFSNPFDRLAQGATTRFTRTVSTTSPLSGSLTAETTPGTGDVPNGADLEAWSAWAQSHYRSNWHPIGTAAMMSQSLGGSVNSNHSVVSLRMVKEKQAGPDRLGLYSTEPLACALLTAQIFPSK